MPLAAPVCNRSIPQFPVPPKSQKAQGLRNKPCIGTIFKFINVNFVCVFICLQQHLNVFFLNT